MTRRPLCRAVLVAACAALLATNAPAAEAAPGDVSVVLTLRPADPAALRHATSLPANASPAARRAALAQARPTSGADVAKYLRRNGFEVTANDGWTIAARGREDVAKTLHHPAVASVAGRGEQRPWRHRAIPAGYTGPQLRSAYDVVAGDGSGLTIATVQFSGWTSSDLTTYATAAGLTDPDPVEIAVAGADPTETSSGGDFEVALDQEVLLAAAPKAGQRIYFAPNTGLADAVLLYSAIANDAEAGHVDVVSTSWGMCELYADLDPDGRAGMETQLARIVAAGATVFAASGDLGAYDCGDEVAEPHVDYPAASPHVVGVGGTTLTQSGSSWTETVWNDTSTGYAGGGGESSTVPRPSWQDGVTTNATRLVPDVSAMADPKKGFGAYSASYGGWVLGGGTSAGAPLLAGHLAAVLSAEGRTSGVGDIHDEIYANPGAFRDVTSGNNQLYSAGPGYDRASGLGTPRWSALSAALFGDPVVSAPAVTRTLTVPLTVTPPPGTVTAWAVGENAASCTGATTVTAPTSYTFSAGDRATRVAVAALTENGCLVGTAPVLIDTRKPVATGSIKPLAYDARTVFTWGASDPAPSSGLTYDICVYALGTGCVWTRTATAAKTVTLSLSQGRSYVLRVTPVDRAGNRGSRLSTGRYAVPLDQASMSRSSGWVATRNSADWYGSHYGSIRPGTYLAKVLAGTRYEVIYLAHPKGGVFDVYVSGRLVKRVNTYAAVKTYRKVTTAAAYSARASRAVRIVVRSGHVAVDGMRVRY